MGCDIHSIGQVKKDGKWTTVIGRPGGDGRNYDSFAVLANVRNGSGFAGVRTGDGWPYIAEPRGLPKGLELDEDEYAHCPPYDSYGRSSSTVWLGDHSHSWLLLSELEEFAEKTLKSLTYNRTGVVDYDVWKAIRDGKLKEPTEWFGSISGAGVKVISADAAASGEIGTYVKMSWPKQALDCLYTFKNYIEKLREIAAKEKVSAEHVRLVFGFDS